jgi:hypothetical protein
VTLNNVSVEAATGRHASFKVYPVASFQRAEVSSVQCFLYSRNFIGFAGYTGNGKAYSIVAQALVNLEFACEWAGQNEMKIILLLSDFAYQPLRFNNACKHAANQRKKCHTITDTMAFCSIWQSF